MIPFEASLGQDVRVYRFGKNSTIPSSWPRRHNSVRFRQKKALEYCIQARAGTIFRASSDYIGSGRAAFCSLPQPNSGVPEFGQLYDGSKSETSDLDVGQGWGGGYLFDSAGMIPPSRLARSARDIAMLRIAFFEQRRPKAAYASPTRGEVTGASC